jgi:adenosylcobinamide-phosphate synthase
MMAMDGLSVSERLGATAVGYLLDQLLGEPPEAVHPLPAFGRMMSAIEERIYRDDRRSGVYYATCGAGIGALTGTVFPSTAVAAFLACGGRALVEAADALDAKLRANDLVAAREAVRALVGRDTDLLDERQLARAAIESVAENTVDAVVAPLLFAAVAGAPGALGCRAVNTLDALVGYRTIRYRRFGWASARLDDLMNFIPARLTALLVILVRPRRTGEVLRVVRRDARAHPSPNAGVAESAFAAALGLRLGGENTYAGIVEVRPFLGDGRSPERTDIAQAVRLSRDVGAAAAGSAAILSLMLCWFGRDRTHRGCRGR